MSDTPQKELIHGKIINVMRKIKAVGKDRNNSSQGYKFRGIDDIFNEVHPYFADEGIYTLGEVLEHTREERPSKSGGVLITTVQKIRYTFSADDGSKVHFIALGEGTDSGDKSCNKGMSVAIKYAIMQMLMIPTEDAKDPENDNPDPLPKNSAPPVVPEPNFKGPWQDYVWSPSFGNSKDKSFAYKGKTLGEIEKADPGGLLYWVKTYEPKHHTQTGVISQKSVDFRAALTAAGGDLQAMAEARQAALAAEGPQVAPDEPKATNVAQTELGTLLGEIRAYLADAKIPEVYMASKFVKKGTLPKDATTIDELPMEAAKWAYDNFQWFVAQYAKAAK